MKKEHEQEMADLKRKMETEKESKAAMASEIESMKKEYESKLKDLEDNAAKAKQEAQAPGLGRSISVMDDQGNVVRVMPDGNAPVNGVTNGGTALGKRKSIGEMQQEAMLK